MHNLKLKWQLRFLCFFFVNWIWGLPYISFLNNEIFFSYSFSRSISPKTLWKAMRHISRKSNLLLLLLLLLVTLLFRDLSSLTWDWIESRSCEVEFLCLNHWIATELPAFLPEDGFLSGWERNQKPGTQHLFWLLYLVLHGILVNRMRTEGMWVCVYMCVVCYCIHM